MRLLLTGVLLLSVAAIGSLFASPLPEVTLPSAAMILVAAALTILASNSRLPRLSPSLLGPILLFLGGCFLVFALLATNWPPFKMPWLAGLYSVLGTLHELAGGTSLPSINANQSGGVAAAVFALAAALPIVGGAGRAGLPLRVISAILAVLALGVVTLTGSRAALAASALALLFLLVMANRRWLWLPAGAFVAGALIIAVDPAVLSQLAAVFLRDETLDTKLVARLDIWLSALRGIEDHAITGIGLGVFNEVVPLRYPYESVGLAYSVSQAHNVFLDTALTLGLPGLIGLVCLLGGIGVQASQAGRAARALPVVAGLLAVTVVFVVFGLTDALSFSTPFSLVIWLVAVSLCLLPKLDSLST